MIKLSKGQINTEALKNLFWALVSYLIITVIASGIAYIDSQYSYLVCFISTHLTLLIIFILIKSGETFLNSVRKLTKGGG